MAEWSGARTHNTVGPRGFLSSWDRAPGWAVIMVSSWERLFTHISSPHPGVDGYPTIDSDGNCQIAKA